jgi:hypothetical protein
METSMRITVSVLVLAAAAMLTGCEDNGVVASPEAEMIITASPEEVIIDEEAGESSGESTITVQVLEGNFVANGVNVFFEASGGILHRNCIAETCEVTGGDCTESSTCTLPTTEAVVTNANGLATAQLTLNTNDPGVVTVIANSGTNSASVEVSKTVNFDELPTAVLEITPPTAAVINENVIFDGTLSSDPDGQIFCYQFDITGTNINLVRGETAGIYSTQFSDLLVLNVILRVSDDPAAGGSNCALLTPASPLFRAATRQSYDICDRMAVVPPRMSRRWRINGTAVTVSRS